MAETMNDRLWGGYYPEILQLMNDKDIIDMEQRITDLYVRYDLTPLPVKRKESDKERIHRVFKMFYCPTRGYTNFSFADAPDRDKWEYLDWLEKFILHYAQISL